MQDVSKEWLDFRRNQFPAGSRIQTWELDDPRNTLKEARKLDYIDDSGRFHVRQSDGGECVLTLGEEMFSVHPPESTQLKLYMPLTASFYARNEWGDWDETGEEWDGRTLLDYEDRILGFMVRNRVPEEAERGLMLWCDKEFLDVKVRSAVFTAEARGGRLWGVAECQVVGQLSPEELTSLKDYLTGQAADGVGEGLEQQAIRVDGGELYVHLWQSEGWSIQTEGERFGQTQIQEPHDDVVPTEAQHNRFGGERSSGEMSEPCPQGEAKGMERGMTMGGM
ncbi:DUF4314 domain-containing protein, partial [Flavonifractor plautii]